MAVRRTYTMGNTYTPDSECALVVSVPVHQVAATRSESTDWDEEILSVDDRGGLYWSWSSPLVEGGFRPISFSEASAWWSDVGYTIPLTQQIIDQARP